MDIEEIIRKLGGPMRVAKLVGIDAPSVYRWKRPRMEGGYEYIPSPYWARLVNTAPFLSIELLHNLKESAKQRPRRNRAS